MATAHITGPGPAVMTGGIIDLNGASYLHS